MRVITLIQGHVLHLFRIDGSRNLPGNCIHRLSHGRHFYFFCDVANLQRQIHREVRARHQFVSRLEGRLEAFLLYADGISPDCHFRGDVESSVVRKDRPGAIRVLIGDRNFGMGHGSARRVRNGA